MSIKNLIHLLSASPMKIDGGFHCVRLFTTTALCRATETPFNFKITIILTEKKNWIIFFSLCRHSLVEDN